MQDHGKDSLASSIKNHYLVLHDHTSRAEHHPLPHSAPSDHQTPCAEHAIASDRCFLGPISPIFESVELDSGVERHGICAQFEFAQIHRVMAEPIADDQRVGRDLHTEE